VKAILKKVKIGYSQKTWAFRKFPIHPSIRVIHFPGGYSYLGNDYSPGVPLPPW